MSGNGKSKSVIVALGTCLVLIISLLAGSLGFSMTQARKINKFIDDELERQAKEEEQLNGYQEDGYKVAEEYEIRSTKQISDAYLSGDDSNLSDLDKKTLKTAKKILEKETKGKTTPFEKERAIYLWMYNNIGQGESTMVARPTAAVGSDFTPQGVLESKNAVCVGYATTFRMFMQMMEMDCHIVHNDYHSWDLVKLDDDKWYHVDIYSDVSSRTEGANFNMTDAVASGGHDWDTSALPAADGVKYTYASMFNKKVKDIYAVPKLLKKAIDKKKHSLYYSFEQKITEDDFALADVLVMQVNSALMQTDDGNIDVSGRWYETEDSGYVLGLFVMDYSGDMEQQEDTVSDKETEKMTNKISDVFGVTLDTDIDYEDMEYEEDMADTATAEMVEEFADEDGE